MNAEFKKRWVEALRSGKYKQGTSMLRSESNKFCCLGVACDLAAPEKWELHGGMYKINGEGGGVPPCVQEKVGLDDILPRFHVGNGTETSLHYLNDSGLSFNQIADVIEHFL